MRLPKWLRPADATLPELEQQHRAAQAQLDSAVATEQEAESAFDASGDPTTQKALRDARDARQIAAEHVGRAKRLLSAARDREAAARRAELTRRRDELIAGLERPVITAEVDPLLRRELALLQELVEVRVQRLGLRDEIQSRERELRAADLELDPNASARNSTTSYVTNPVLTCRAIEKLAEGIAADDPRRSLLLALRPAIGSYVPRITSSAPAPRIRTFAPSPSSDAIVGDHDNDRLRVAPNCEFSVAGRRYEPGAEVDPAILQGLLQEIPLLDRALQANSIHEFVEIIGSAGSPVVRGVTPTTYATPARAASCEVDGHGQMQKHPERAASTGKHNRGAQVLA